MPMNAGRAAPRKASHSAARSEPRPDAAIRKPYPVAPLWRTSSASGGMTTLKFMPTVETSPMTRRLISTTGVRRT